MILVSSFGQMGDGWTSMWTLVSNSPFLSFETIFLAFFWLTFSEILQLWPLSVYISSASSTNFNISSRRWVQSGFGCPRLSTLTRYFPSGKRTINSAHFNRALIKHKLDSAESCWAERCGFLGCVSYFVKIHLRCVCSCRRVQKCINAARPKQSMYSMDAFKVLFIFLEVQN